jgi:hypothetical protein
MAAIDKRIDEYWKGVPADHVAKLQAFAKGLPSGIKLEPSKQKQRKKSPTPHKPHLMVKIRSPVDRPGLKDVSILGMLPDGSLYTSGYGNRIGSGQPVKESGSTRDAEGVTPWKLSDSIWQGFVEWLNGLDEGFALEGSSLRAHSAGKHVAPQRLSVEKLRRISARIERLITTTSEAHVGRNRHR